MAILNIDYGINRSIKPPALLQKRTSVLNPETPSFVPRNNMYQGPREEDSPQQSQAKGSHPAFVANTTPGVAQAQPPSHGLRSLPAGATSETLKPKSSRSPYIDNGKADPSTRFGYIDFNEYLNNVDAAIITMPPISESREIIDANSEISKSATGLVGGRRHATSESQLGAGLINQSNAAVAGDPLNDNVCKHDVEVLTPSVPFAKKARDQSSQVIPSGRVVPAIPPGLFSKRPPHQQGLVITKERSSLGDEGQANQLLQPCGAVEAEHVNISASSRNTGALSEQRVLGKAHHVFTPDPKIDAKSNRRMDYHLGEVAPTLDDDKGQASPELRKHPRAVGYAQAYKPTNIHAAGLREFQGFPEDKKYTDGLRSNYPATPLPHFPGTTPNAYVRQGPPLRAGSDLGKHPFHHHPQHISAPYQSPYQPSTQPYLGIDNRRPRQNDFVQVQHSRRKRVDQGPEPSAADIYPEDYMVVAGGQFRGQNRGQGRNPLNTIVENLDEDLLQRQATGLHRAGIPARPPAVGRNETPIAYASAYSLAESVPAQVGRSPESPIATRSYANPLPYRAAFGRPETTNPVRPGTSTAPTTIDKGYASQIPYTTTYGIPWDTNSSLAGPYIPHPAAANTPAGMPYHSAYPPHGPTMAAQASSSVMPPPTTNDTSDYEELVEELRRIQNLSGTGNYGPGDPDPRPLSPGQLDGSRYGLRYWGLGMSRCGDTWAPPKVEEGTNFRIRPAWDRQNPAWLPEWEEK